MKKSFIKKIFKKAFLLAKKVFIYALNVYNNQRPSCLILIYHRIINLENDPQLLAVSPRNFEAQIKYLKSNFNIISLQELVKSLSKKKIPKNSVVITFDDGYNDNLYYAKPILEKYNVPATVFVTAGMIDSQREFWWDELERIFLISDNIFKPLEVNINGKIYRWDIQTRVDARKVYEQLHPLLKGIPSQDRDTLIIELFNWANLDINGRENFLPLTTKELITLQANDLIEIGSHTMTHSSLCVETQLNQKWEILESKKALEKILNIPIRSFSYPFGTSFEVKSDTRKFVAKAGYNCGIANEQGLVYNSADLFWIPRILIRNWDINEFRVRLGSFLKHEDLFTKLYQKLCKYILDPVIALYQYKKTLQPLIKKNTLLQSTKKAEFNVLMINTSDNVGGAAKVAFQLSQRLQNENIQTRMLVARSVMNNEFINLLPFKPLYQRSKSLEENTGLLDFFYMGSLKIKDSSLFNESEVIHLHNLHGGYFSPFALPELTFHKPVVWTLHDMQAITGHCAHSYDCDKWLTGCDKCPYLSIYPAITKDTTAFLWKIKKAIYENSKMIIVCPSQWLKKKVESSILRKQEIRLIYNGIDQSVFKNIDKRNARLKLRLPEDKKILAFCASGGKENIWKGGNYLLGVFEALKTAKNIMFLNIGGNSSSGTENWVNIPYISNENLLALYYAASDLFVYPSEADNCPLVVLEALACGTPVITFRTGGIPELVEHLKTGYIAEYKNLNDLIKGINLFLNNNELYNAAQDNARLTVENKFTLDLMYRNYVNLYHEAHDNFNL